MVYATKEFWLAAIDRMIRTFAQSMLAVIGVEAIGIFDADWKAILSIAAMAALGSLLTSISTPTTVAEGVIKPTKLQPVDVVTEDPTVYDLPIDEATYLERVEPARGRHKA